jgi:hypothetical protein
MIPAFLRQAVEEKLSDKLNISISITNEHSIGGGCINSAHRIDQ